MFLKVEQGLSGLGQAGRSVLMRQPGGRLIRVRMPIVLRPKRGVGAINLPAGYGAQRGITEPAPTAVNYASAPGCNVVNLQNNQCMLDDGTVTGCNIIQECDSLTGNARCQYGPFPGQAADPSLPFCSGSGPSVSYVPNPNLTTPAGPATPFTPTKVFAANSGVVLPAGSSASIAPSGGGAPSSSSPASTSTPASAQPSSQTNFLQQLLAGPNPPAGGSSSTTTVVQSGGGFFSDSADIFGVLVPYWLIGVVVIGGGLLLMSGGKK